MLYYYIWSFIWALYFSKDESKFNYISTHESTSKWAFHSIFSRRKVRLCTFTFFLPMLVKVKFCMSLTVIICHWWLCHIMYFCILISNYNLNFFVIAKKTQSRKLHWRLSKINSFFLCFSLYDSKIKKKQCTIIFLRSFCFFIDSTNIFRNKCINENTTCIKYFVQAPVRSRGLRVDECLRWACFMNIFYLCSQSSISRFPFHQITVILLLCTSLY